MADITESEVVRQVREVIAATGLCIQRLNAGAFHAGGRRVKGADAGTCDFEGYDNYGRFVAIECKRPEGGRLSREQRARIADINKKGGVAFVARSGEEALEKLRFFGCVG